MLNISYTKIVKDGFYWDSSLKSYKDIDINFIMLEMSLFKYFFFKTMILRFEEQLLFYKFKELSMSLNRLKIFNIEFLKVFPPLRKIKHLKNINIVRLFLIKSHRGKCLFLGKPSKGQRTWSNASTSKNSPKVLKIFKKKKNNLVDSWV